MSLRPAQLLDLPRPPKTLASDDARGFAPLPRERTRDVSFCLVIRRRRRSSRRRVSCNALQQKCSGGLQPWAPRPTVHFRIAARRATWQTPGALRVQSFEVPSSRVFRCCGVLCLRPQIVGPMEEIAYGPSAWPRGEHGLDDAWAAWDLKFNRSHVTLQSAQGFGTTCGAPGSAGTFCHYPVVPTRPPQQRFLT